jgi:hypothetical protein
MDIVDNYNAISEHSEKWTDLSDYSTGVGTTLTMARKAVANAPNLNTVIFNGQEYALFKRPLF